MTDLPQRELRNNISAVLRAAEAGATYTVSVDGRPVAQLGPHRPRQWVRRAAVEELLATPTDLTALDDVRAHDLEDGLQGDPWTRGWGALLNCTADLEDVVGLEGEVELRAI